ncbi:hypothetical protein AMTRI_Chr11g152230 [Amborella trichopoda]|uniref:Homeobox domain-containing protein n=1 Tax=Amborella trichopoda TaxID=13333 RepID=U5D0Z5_AMBTC|nr:BEL1-like homeodomain protein 1 [Amborella trichopoda]XP_020529357.1 BEL1-like homeodomain protein 1 [Amborella trichopoda]XP_020529358.1 BEL1-like homeodomain protein 1 [Amborella trichopoda]XP_020529359.1 BEL1-like homeodomain protein 1 [Amborella trichopoda]ERN16094.1 hypothetical protein AMTR_s00030p00173920 [Amborella trichopoda]|eukprot:XP_006854627.1 BEL1-like homeodomain protein 1 [Amborella trichopoda]
MATYYPGTEIQPDNLQTLYLMNPGYVGYAEATPSANPGNMVLLNHVNGNPLTIGTNLSQNPNQQPQHFIGIPLQGPDPQRQVLTVNPTDINPNLLASRISGHHQYNQWRNSGNELTFLQAIDQSQASTNPSQIANMNSSVSLSHHQPVQEITNSQMGIRRGPMASDQTQQGALSLSLSSQQPSNGQFSFHSSGHGVSQSMKQGTVDSVSSNLQGVLMGSKYLKAAQELLDEVVSVGKGVKTDSGKREKSQVKIGREMAVEGSGAESSGKKGSELSTVERQEVQMKKAKLVAMLDEVDQRYRQYHHQMHLVVSSFEAAAGLGAAKTYTALALQTISRQFRCLRDAISSQIKSASKALGEEDCLNGGRGEGSRLRYVDHQLRQQRALQQLGMIPHNAWRPQRGLPERSVSVLRAWLFEHFLHPYPKDADKHMLAKQTGLTRSQVSNWFINARVRLWKPMVEEMYMEEMREQEQDKGSDEKTSKSEINDDSSMKSGHQENNPTEQNNHLLIPKQDANNEFKSSSTSGFSLIKSPGPQDLHEREALEQGPPKKLMREKISMNLHDTSSLPSIEVDLKSEEANSGEYIKFGDGRQSREDFGLDDHGGGFGSAYHIGDLGRFGHEQFAPRFSGNGVSLTLGLPHCDSLSLAGTQQAYLSNPNLQMGRRHELGGEPNDFCSMNTASATAHSANPYENLSIQNRKRFAAQLLPDFVA